LTDLVGKLQANHEAFGYYHIDLIYLGSDLG
jgi:hypothetical protein